MFIVSNRISLAATQISPFGSYFEYSLHPCRAQPLCAVFSERNPAPARGGLPGVGKREYSYHDCQLAMCARTAPPLGHTRHCMLPRASEHFNSTPNTRPRGVFAALSWHWLPRAWTARPFSRAPPVQSSQQTAGYQACAAQGPQAYRAARRASSRQGPYAQHPLHAAGGRRRRSVCRPECPPARAATPCLSAPSRLSAASGGT